MKRVVLSVFVMMFIAGTTLSQNVFDAADPIVRYNATAAYGTTQRPDTNIIGLQKWVAAATNGVSSGNGAFDASSFKAYYINYFNTRISFRLKFPRSYGNPDSVSKKYPVMLFMHGAGEVGCTTNGGIYNNEKQLVHGGKLFMDRVDNNQFDGFLLYPQLRSADGSCWGEWGGGVNARFNTIITIIDSLVKYVRLNNDRVFVDGLSGGAVAAWRLAESYPTRIAKIAPTSGAGLSMNYPAFVHIPVWLATGGRDNNPSPAMAAYSEQKVTELGGEMRRSLYADLGHSSWYRHWQEPDFVPYMNDVHKANPLIFFNRFEFCADEAVNARLGITPGYYAYEWEKDGVLIATRTGSANTIINGASIISFTGNEITVKQYGTYRVRFRRVNNGIWSDWSPKPAIITVKAATQTPPIGIAGIKSKVLPSLDGKNTVTLQLPAGFTNYQWLRTTDNVIVNTTQQYEAPIGTYQARYTEPFGCGSLYSPVFKVVNAAGTPKPDEAKNLSVTALSQTILRLDWNENPNAGTNETGFEIYRSAESGGPYTLLHITAPNVIAYTDSNLVPNTSYYYLVRAVSETGAAAASTEGIGKTEIDDIAPSAPANLQYRGSTATTVKLRWQAASDNTGIGRYDIYGNGIKLYSTTALEFTAGNLDSLTSYTFVVKAIDKAGNASPSSNQVIAYTHRQGLTYKYYHGSFSTIPNFSLLTPVKTGIIDTVNAGQSLRLQEDNYAFLWEGRICIPISGTYTFETASDDGSKLYIDVPYSSAATALVDNDGSHGLQSRTGTKYLTQGYHVIAIAYTELTGDNEMNLYWSNSVGQSRERIPKNFFSLDDNQALAPLAAPGNLTATPLSYNKVLLNWNDSSSDESGFEVTRSLSVAGPFVPIYTTGPNVTTYTDSALSAATHYYYKIRAVSANGESSFTSAFTEANWKFNNDYNEAEGRISLVSSTTVFDTDKVEGSHAVDFSNGDFIDFNGPSSGFPSQGGYNQRTVGLWIKPSAVNNKRILFEFGGSSNGLGLRFNSNDLVAGIASGSSRSTITLNSFANNNNWLSDQWNHVVLVYNVSALELYLNGVLVASTQSLPFISIGSTFNASRIGDRSGTTNGSTVFNDGNYSSYQGLMDDFIVIRGALTPAEINALKNGTFKASSARTLDAPQPPAEPGGLLANVLSTNAVYLAWNDNSNNETGFEIWRSSGDKTNNRMAAKVPAANGGQVNFTDTTLFANVTYYYTVRASGEVSPSAFSSEVAARTLNTKPVLKKIVNFTMKYGTKFTLPVTATDLDGDMLTFSTLKLPSFAVITPVSNGNINITFSPPVTRRGSYPITIIVADGNDGRDSSAFTLVVNTNAVPVLAPIEDISMNEGGEATMSFSASDNNGTSKMIWSFEGLPSFATFTNNNNGSGTVAFKPGYSASGEYPVTVIVNDGYGAWTSRSMLLTVIEKDPDETLQFNFRSQSAAVPLWNSVNIAAPGFSHGTISDTKMNISTVALNLVSGSVGASVLGPQTGDNSGVYPDLIMKDLMRWGFSMGTNAMDTIVVRASGLDAKKNYNFIFYAGYSLNGVSTSVSTYRIGNALATVNYYQNTTMTDTIENVTPNASGEVFITMIGDPNTNRGGLLNAMIIKANFDDGSTPTKPLNFTGKHANNSGVELKWEDRAFNEWGYKVYRSLSKTSGYQLLNEGANNKDSVSYFDNTVAPETTYYYHVSGFNGAGEGTSSDTLKIVTGNNKPLIAVADQIYVKSDAVKHVDFPVTDDAGDVVNVSLDDEPSFVQLLSLGAGSYRLVLSPLTDHIGWFTATLKATDQKGAVAVKQLSIAVSDKNTRSVYVNLGSAQQSAPTPWNNWLGVRTANSVLPNLKDETNTTTPFSITMVSSWSGVTDIGHMTGNNSGVYADAVLSSGITDGGGPRTIRINGLNDAMKYNIVIVASHNEGTNAAVEYASGTVKDTVNARYNTQQTANLNGLVPVSGELTITNLRIDGSALAILNALVIEEYDPSIPVLNPLNLYAEAVNQTSIDLSWSDRTLEEDVSGGYVLERAKDSLFNNELVTVPLSANTSTYRTVGLAPNTRYWFRVRAKTAGGALSGYSNRARAITPASSVSVNFNYTLPDARYPWNNTFASPTFEGTMDNLINQSGMVSGLSLTLTKIFNGEFTAGMNTGNNSGIVPDNVLAANYWLDNSQESQYKISGLNHSRRYRIGFIGSSSSAGWFRGNYTATYTVNGRTVYLNSWMNSSKIVYINDLRPDANGELYLNFSTTEAAAYGFNAGVIIEDYSVPGEITVVVENPVILESPVESADQEQLPQTRRQVAANTVSIYPNPFRDYFNLDFNNASSDDRVGIEVYDLSGRITHRRSLGRLPKGSNTVRLDAAKAGMETGVYIVTLSINGKTIQANKVLRLAKPL